MATPLPLPLAASVIPKAFLRNVAERMARNRETYAQPVQVPPAPAGVSIDRRMEEAAARRDPFWFYNKTHDHGAWDTKFQGPKQKYEPYGNFQFGAVGTALGFSPEILRRGAGAYQIYKDAKRNHRINLANGVPWGGYPYGDNPDDQPRIDLGIRYAKERGF
jgi:hypothetical protein